MKRENIAEFGGPRQYHAPSDAVVRGVARQKSHEIAVRPECVLSQPHVERIVVALVRIHRVVAVILNERTGEQAQLHGLREQRDQEGGNFQSSLIHAYPPVGITVVQLDGFRRPLLDLQRTLLPFIRKGIDITRILIQSTDGKRQIPVPGKSGPSVGEQGALLNGREPRAQRDAVAHSPKIAARHIEGDARREAGLAGRRVQAM